MTRKQYRRKVMQLQRKINIEAKKKGHKGLAKTDRVNTPYFGSIIRAGVHSGERLVSYKQAWETVESLLKDTDLL